MPAQTENILDQSLDSIYNWLDQNVQADTAIFGEVGRYAIAQAKKIDDKKLQAELHSVVASWHGYHGLTTQDSVINHDYKALALFRELGDQASEAKTLGLLSIDLQNGGNFDQAQEIAFEAIDLYQELGDEEGVANGHRSLAYLFHSLNEPDKSTRFGLLAYDYYKKVDDYDRMSYTLLSLIQSYTDSKEYHKAQEVAQECIDLVTQEIPGQVFVLGRAYSRKGRVSLIEGKLNQALEESRMAFRIVEKEVGAKRAVTFRQGIGHVLYKQGKWQEALAEYTTIIKATDNQNIDVVTDLLEKTADCYRQLGNYEEAYNFKSRYAESEIEKLKIKVDNLTTQAAIKYETGKKDEAISNQATQLKQKNRIQLVGIVSIAVLALLLSVLYNLFKKSKRTAQSLALRNTENEFLVKEIHHRVKNNLQILSSLLSLQSNYITNVEAVDAIKEGQNRVESMGMIHQRLYSGEDKTAIDMSEYIDDVCAYLEDSFLLKDRRISIVSNCEVGLADVETVIPLGLIINELITNSIKYAFAEDEKGEIKVELTENQSDQLCLIVSDNGKGVVAENQYKGRSTNFGSDLVKVLIRKLKGTLTQESKDGYSTSIVFDRYKLIRT